MELGEPGEDGRRRPVPVEGSEFIIQSMQLLKQLVKQDTSI